MAAAGRAFCTIRNRPRILVAHIQICADLLIHRHERPITGVDHRGLPHEATALAERDGGLLADAAAAGLVDRS
eukprot:COSAG05_NODE_11499_length_510_cov_1.364964_2_plen_73_part_00